MERPECPPNEELRICVDECPDEGTGGITAKGNEVSKPTECDPPEGAFDSDLYVKTETYKLARPVI